jgi:hypothetical protein
MEVMGLMLGEFVDDYTIRVADVFAMPQVRFFFSFLRFRWRTRETTTRKKNLDPDLSFSLLSPTELATTNKTEQSGTGVSVEAVDPVFQTRMLDMLRQVGRPEMVRERERVEVFSFLKSSFCFVLFLSRSSLLLVAFSRSVFGGDAFSWIFLCAFFSSSLLFSS